MTRLKPLTFILISFLLITFGCQKSEPIDEFTETGESATITRTFISDYEGASWDVVLRDEDGYEIYLRMNDSINAYSIYTGLLCAPDKSVGVANAMYSPDLKLLNIIGKDSYFDDVVSYSVQFRNRGASIATSIIKYMDKDCGYDLMVEIMSGRLATHLESANKILKDTQNTRCGTERSPRRNV